MFSFLAPQPNTPGPSGTGSGFEGSGTDGGGYGTGSYSSVSCGGTYTLGKGEFTSPSYPYNYPSSAYCKYLIEQPEGATITLEFTDMAIENSRSKDDNGVVHCHYDYVEVGQNLHVSFQRNIITAVFRGMVKVMFYRCLSVNRRYPMVLPLVISQILSLVLTGGYPWFCHWSCPKCCPWSCLLSGGGGV